MLAEQEKELTSIFIEWSQKEMGMNIDSLYSTPAPVYNRYVDDFLATVNSVLRES